ncbi:MAG TPA: divergent polysaccharide deacetylase family protein [Candidatus Sulfotelmatobacter sp.]|nr:divergent polysaccharide deacetylase family protein [Candidatus Sulfotelmatobacter sp.]
MYSTFSGFGRVAKLLVCFSVLTISFSLTGCGKIRSLVDSVLHAPRSSKARPSSRPSTAVVSGPRLAIILDDVAADPSAVDAVFSLRYPLTLSILPNHPHSTQIAQEARRRGYQVMLHLPMESLANEVPETQELRPGMSSGEISSVLNSMLESVPTAVGVNNHQGSLATSDPHLMAELMPLLRTHHLFFIDSRTTTATVAYDSAQSAGVPCAFRNVPFLDDVREVAAIRRQFQLVLKEAREKHEAVAIGHPHPETLRALSELLPQAEAEGIHLVHASDLVH